MHPLILLAGGASSRANQPKGLIPFQNKTWLEHQLSCFESCGGTEAFIVLGFDTESYLQELPWLSAPNALFESKLHVIPVFNEKAELGQFSSLQVGIRALTLRSNPEAAFVLPIDVPVANSEVWQSLSQHLLGDVAVCIPTFQERGGHPVLLSPKFAKTLDKLNPALKNSRLDLQIRQLSQAQVCSVPVTDSAILKNMNKLSDFLA